LAGLTLLALSSLLTPVAASTAHAQSADETKARAKALFEQGVADYDAGRYEQALASFQEAYRIRPHPLVNVNIANCYDKLGKSLLAVFHFQRFLESDAGSPAQRDEVNKALERLKPQVGKLLLRITPDGALAIIDQGEQRKSPILEPIQLEAGKHDLEVKLAGYRAVQRPLIVKGGTTLELSISLEPEGQRAPVPVIAVAPRLEPEPAPARGPEPVAAAGTAQESAPAILPTVQPNIAPLSSETEQPEVPANTRARADHGPNELPTSVWIAGGVTLALVAVATITGVLALRANSDFEHYKDALFDPTATTITKVTAYNEAQDAADRANGLALTTDILLGGALIGAAATTYLIITAQDEEQPSHARLVPMLSPRSAGLGLQTKF
jgi:tetratricopeptide (TPR) repeat protein